MERRNSGVVRTGGDAGEPVVACLRRPQRQADRVAVRIVAAETRAQLVQHRRLQEVGPGHRNRFAADAVLRGEVTITRNWITGPRGVLAIDHVVAEAPEDAVVRREVMVDAYVPRGGVVGHRILELVVRRTSPASGLPLPSHRSREIRVRVQGQQLHPYRVDARCRDDVPGDTSVLAGYCGIR